VFGALNPVPNAAGWNNTDVSVPYTTVDDLSGVATSAPPSALSFVSEGSGLTQSVTVTDVADNTATFESPAVQIDKTNPVITTSATKIDTTVYTAGTWTNLAVTVHFTCSDAGAGVTTCPADQLVSAEGITAAISGTATDNAGNSTTAGFGPVWIDTPPPTMSAAPSPLPNAAGWHDTDVTVTFLAEDTLSGVVSVSSPVVVSDEGAGQIIEGSAVDLAGNEASVSLVLNIDKTSPEAVNRFDPDTLDIVVIGLDDDVELGPFKPILVEPLRVGAQGKKKGRHEPNGERRTYEITDVAGNTLVLVEDVVRLPKGRGKRKSRKRANGGAPLQEGRIRARVVGLQYNDGEVLALPAQTATHFHWRLIRDGSLGRLTQTMAVLARDTTREVRATFDAKNDITRVDVIKPKADKAT
jgi:hypothetical protein